MATGALSPTPRQWFANDGTVLAGGSITTSLTGTSTAAPTYTDIDLASPSHLHSNAIVLNSAGRPPASIYIPRGTGYRFVVKDSAGATVETIDGIIVYDDTYTPPTWAQVPTGVWLPYGGTSAPTGYLMCDGSAVSRTTYAALFGVISTTWGAGDGATTFNVPDMRGRFPFGKAAATGTGDALGETFGTIDHVHTGPSHTHTTSGATAAGGAQTVSGATAAGGTEAVTGSTASGTASLDTTTAATFATTGGTTAVTDVHDDGHTHGATGLSGPSHAHAYGTLAVADHTHAYGTLAAVAAGTGNTGAGNPPSLVVNYIIKT